MTRELNVGVDAASSAGLSSWKRRKCARWLVPNCVSKPSFVFPLGGGHHSGVADEHVQRLRLGEEGGRAVPHRLQRLEVQLQHVEAALAVRQAAADVGGHRLAPRHVPHRHEHAGASGIERAGRLHADAVGGAGDEHHPVGPLAEQLLVLHDGQRGGPGVAFPLRGDVRGCVLAGGGHDVEGDGSDRGSYSEAMKRVGVEG